MTKNEDFEWGKKMIKISVQFWTNNLPKGTDNKTAWASGAIHMTANKHRGLKHNHIFFNRMEDFMPKLHELLKRNGVKLIKPPEKYVEVDISQIGTKE